ncbi:phytoene/squalene synthase family protein [Smaragdicoccus niigatensis]|uniref:phytoene/squalene synthase family protein n=1 Tax=Smaragdicoccus niigatensis TaxID=359359 RepID=UPI0003780DE9|nr:phytoene/squalene synthase family protein [Smaragdicoccus niigatensis]
MRSEETLRAAYTHARNVAAGHGRTYYLATRMLPAERRSAIHALYAFARMVDDVIDVEAGHQLSYTHCAEQLDLLEHYLRQLTSGVELPDDHDIDDETRHVLAALTDTIRRFDIASEPFWDFFASMRMDLPGTPTYHPSYQTMADLKAYMRGSAAGIGLQMVPVLGTIVDVHEAEPYAAALGEAFQVTNFLRDVGEDLDRDRVYLPADELAAFGVDEDLLRHCHATGTTDRRLVRALAHFIALNRGQYRYAVQGIPMLSPIAQPAIWAAYRLYSSILDYIEEGGYPVLHTRVIVPNRRRLAIALPLAGKALAHRAVG